MRAMILAAGRGERMRPLTDYCPKPLLPAADKPLIVYHLERLAAAGFKDIVINHAHLGEQLLAALGNGAQWGLSITWSPEPVGALETAGGICQALPHLDAGNDAPFLVINGDIYCDWPIQSIHLAQEDLARLVLVDNPPQHPTGDFVLQGQRVSDKAAAMPTLTFAGIGFYRPSLFKNLTAGEPAKLAPLLRAAMAEHRVSGEHHQGRWEDVGTPERLAALDAELRAGV
ncbi:MAG: N-acetylmuramate alpha-1-phosphate uridylyltransferase MurU [Fluviibacter phosphoraccumulans]